MKKFGKLLILKQPKFWSDFNIFSLILIPFSIIYLLLFFIKKIITPEYKSNIPVISIGNFTVGGTGKTPVAIKTAQLLKQYGYSPVFITRGFGGNLASNVHLVTATDQAHLIGDEAILLAKMATTIVAKIRSDGAKFIEQHKIGNVIILDDAMQHFSLAKDVNILVFDQKSKLQNGLLLPAGPLRQITHKAHVDIQISMNTAENDNITSYSANNFLAKYKALADYNKNLQYSAFAGIAYPDKFFTMLKSLGYKLSHEIYFADHQEYSDEILQSIAKLPNLITTSKDAVKLPEYILKKTVVFEIDLDVENEHGLIDKIIHMVKSCENS